MRGARCLQAAVHLLRPHAAFTAAGESSLLERLQSSWFCSTSSSSFSGLNSSSVSSQAALYTADPLQQYHSQLPCFAARGYARLAPTDSQQGDRFGRSRRRDLKQPAPELSRLQLGRAAEHCKPTEQMREPFYPDNYDPWTDTDKATMMPIMPDGIPGGDLEQPLMLRQQLEGSELPNEFKRAQLGATPFWEEVLLDLNRTVKVTKGGKVETLHAIVVVGNHDGVIGVGEHSGKNVQKVMLDAQLKAYKNLVAIPRYRQHTVYHPLDVRNRKVRIQVWPRQLGFGVTASPLARILCDLAGLHNVTVKLSGNRRNIKQVVYTFLDVLSNQSVPHDGVEGSGVYMREVYHKKALPCGLRRGVDVL